MLIVSVPFPAAYPTALRTPAPRAITGQHLAAYSGQWPRGSPRIFSLLFTWVRLSVLISEFLCHYQSAAHSSTAEAPTGDIIDGWSPKDRALSTLDMLVKEFDQLGRPHYHIIGNHCLYNLPRQARSAMGSCYRKHP